MNVFNNNTDKPMKRESSDSESDDSLTDEETSSSSITEEDKDEQCQKSGELTKNIESSNVSLSSYFGLPEESQCIVQVSKITNKKVHEV